MHCNLRPPDVVPVVLGYLGQICTVHAIRTNCYFPASDQNSDTAVIFGDPDFLYGYFDNRWTLTSIYLCDL